MPQVNCRVCSKEFYIKPSHLNRGWGKYCSMTCSARAQMKGKVVVCFNCSKEVYRSPKQLNRSKSGKFFCTKSCQTLWRNSTFVEEKSPNWKNGKGAYRRILIRSGIKPMCSICSIINPMLLVVHHKDHNRKNNSIANLMWLCFNCHYLVHHNRELEESIIGGRSSAG